jgi:hypothetical protein
MKKLFLILIFFTGNVFAGININPTTPWGFSDTFEYWQSKQDLLADVRNTDKIMNSDSNNVSSYQYYAIFILSKEGDLDEQQKALEKLSAICYNKLRVDGSLNQIADKDRISLASCIRGEFSPQSVISINDYYKYNYNKYRHENIINSTCLNIDLDDVKTSDKDYKHFQKFGRTSLYGAIPPEVCKQYSLYTHKQLSVITDTSSVLKSSGTAKGYVEDVVTILSKDYLQASYEKFSDGVSGACNAFRSTPARPHAQGATKLLSGGVIVGHFYCMRNPTIDINTKIRERCNTANKKVVTGAYRTINYSINEMCNNWNKVGLLSSDTAFWPIAQAGQMQNQVEKKQTNSYSDGLDATKDANSRKYWGNTLKRGDLSKGGRSYKAFVVCVKVGDCDDLSWSKSSVKLQNGSSKTSMYLKGREKMPINQWRESVFAYNFSGVQSSQIAPFNTTYFDIVLPKESIDTYNQITTVVGSELGFVSFSDNLERWLESETEWSNSANGYNCEDKILTHYKDKDVLSPGNYSYSEKEMDIMKFGSAVEGRSNRERATKVIVGTKGGLKPNSVVENWHYKVCNKK